MSAFEIPLSTILHQFGLSGRNWQARPWQGEGYSGSSVWKVFQAVDDNIAAKAYCLKARPQQKLDRQRWGWQVSVLRSTPNLSFLLQPVATLSDDFVCIHADQAWQLEPWATGNNDYSKKPDDARLRSVMRSLAQLHNCWFGTTSKIDCPVFTSPRASNFIPEPLGGLQPNGLRGLPAGLRSIVDGRAIGLSKRLDLLDKWTSQWTSLWCNIDQASRNACRGECWRLAIEEIRQRAESHWSLLREQLMFAQNCSLPLGPVLGDPWSDHFFFEDDRLCAIIDYGAMRIDSVAADLSRSLCSLVGDPSDRRKMALDEYQKIRKLDEREILAEEVYSCSSQVLGPLLWLSWIFLEQRFEPTAPLLDRILKISRAQPF